MKKSFLTLALLCATITTLVAQDITPSKNKFGAILSTNIFGLNNDFNSVAVGGGFFYSRKITNRLSIYSQIDCSWRNYGNVAISPGLSQEFTTGNLAIYVGPMFDIGESMNLSTGLLQNYLFNPELKTAPGTKDISTETRNFSSLFFDFRYQISNEISFGTRYEWGLNSILKTTDSKVTTISFSTFFQFGGKRNL